MDHLEDRPQYRLKHVESHHELTHYFTKRQISWLTVVLIFFLFVLFISGYFLGQKKILIYLNKIDQDNVCLRQKLYSLEPCDETLSNVQMPVAQKKYFYAKIKGFGTLQEANYFVDKLQQQNVSVKIVEKRSATVQGEAIIWYYVVTEDYSSKEDLYALIDRLKREEQIIDIDVMVN